MGKYIKSFDEHDDYAQYVNQSGITRPSIMHCIAEDDIHYNKIVIESLASIANLGDNLVRVPWTPTSDELNYIQTFFDDVCAQRPYDFFPYVWGSDELKVTGDSTNGYKITGGDYYINVTTDFKIDTFYVPIE